MTNEDLVLAIQTGAGDRQELLYVLFKQNTGMIERIIQRCHCSEDPDDLRQESFFGLTRAVDLWDPDKEVTFITYACYWIKQALYRYLENCGSVLRVPTHRRQSIREYYRAVRSFQNSLGRAPTEREIGAALGMKPEEIQAIKKDAQALTIRSTAEPIGEDGDVLEDFLKDPADPIEDLLDRIQREELSNALLEEIHTLDPREATVIIEHFVNGKTLGECGALLGVSTERARQLKEKGLRALRKPKHERRLRAFFTTQGAYSRGLKGTGLSSFLLNGSSQEQAIAHLEHQLGASLYWGRILKDEPKTV